MSTTHGLRALMVAELRGLYDAERQLARALPRLERQARSSFLRDVISLQVDETHEHLERLTQAFHLLGERVGGHHCSELAGILDAANALVQASESGAMRDAGIAAGANRAVYYELGAYGAVLPWAHESGERAVGSLLHETIEEDRATGGRLTALAALGFGRPTRLASDQEAGRLLAAWHRPLVGAHAGR